MIFSYFCMETYVVGTHKKRLAKVLRMSTTTNSLCRNKKTVYMFGQKKMFFIYTYSILLLSSYFLTKTGFNLGPVSSSESEYSSYSDDSSSLSPSDFSSSSPKISWQQKVQSNLS